jgi:ribosomal protein S18 acetylase RimI-like enzyme
MVVRPAKHEDRPRLIELMKGYFAFYRTPFPARNKVEALLDVLEQDPERGVQLVADVEGRLQGFATLYASLDTLIADRILVMNDLFVDPALRNRGVGEALFDASLAYATEHGYTRLDWVTAADNYGAQRFYERHGGQRGPWVSYSVSPSPARGGGQGGGP